MRPLTARWIQAFMIPLLLALAACGDEVVVRADTCSTVATGGAGGAPATGGAAPGGAGGGDPGCVETHDYVRAALTMWNGDVYAPGVEPVDVELSARYLGAVSDDVVLLDTCSPAANCTPLVSALTIVVPNLFIEAHQGAFVRVHLAIEPTAVGWRTRLQIKGLPVWDGVPDPTGGDETLWFLAVDGGTEAFADSPVVVTTEPLGCATEEIPGCSTHEDYALRFRLASDPGDPGVLVPMGKGGTLVDGPPGSYGNLRMTNLRSYASGLCDAPPELAYTVKRHFPGD
jgi:hypothetical protein